jgi:hypothetical protein
MEELYQAARGALFDALEALGNTHSPRPGPDVWTFRYTEPVGVGLDAPNQGGR